jgi:hypothetical protein
MHVNASAYLYACHEMSHAHDSHAKHVQVLGTEGLCPGSPSGRLTGRAGDAPHGTCGRLKGLMTLIIQHR